MTTRGQLIEREGRRDILLERPWEVRRAMANPTWRAAQVIEAMTWSPITIAPEAPATFAEALASQKGITHLPVRDGTHLVGMVCTCDLLGAGPGTRVGDRMSFPVIQTDERETLENAVSRMTAAGVGALPVVVGGRLYGILTRGDLRRAGFVLGTKRCLSCGSHHHVRGRFCLECLDHVAPTPFPEHYTDIGGGD